MLDIAIRVFAVLLLIGAALHAWGSLVAFEAGTAARAWSLGSAAFAAFLAAFGWMVVDTDQTSMSWLLAIGCLAWLLTVGAFGLAIGNLADPRVLYHLVVAAGLGVLAAMHAL